MTTSTTSVSTPAAVTAPTRRLVDERTAAAYLGLSHRTLQAWRVRGGGPHYHRLGRAVRYDLLELDRFIADAECAHTADSAQ
jgi:hypothetical protein